MIVNDKELASLNESIGSPCSIINTKKTTNEGIEINNAVLIGTKKNIPTMEGKLYTMP